MAAMSPTTVSTSTWAARCDSASTTWATSADPKRPKPRRKSSGVPSTTTRSARCLSSAARAQERQLVVGGQRAAAEPVGEHRDAQVLDGGGQLGPRPRPSRRRCRRRTPAARRRRRSAARRATASGSGSAPRLRAGSTAGTSPADGPNTSSGKSRNTGPRCGSAARAMASWTIAPAFAGSVTVAADFVIDCEDRHVVELLQRPGTPPALRRPPAEHDERRPVEPRRRHRRHAVGDAGPGGQRGDARSPGQLGVGLGGERRRLLVAGVDDAHALVAGTPRTAARCARR